MRNKKLLAMASLLCTATLCAGVGVVALGNEANTVVSAETPVYTKTVNGVEYTFEQDFNNLVYSELGDILNKDLKSAKVRTVEGYTGAYHGNNAGNSYITANTMLQLTDAAFTKDSGGIQFQISSETAWNGGARLELCYGDLTINMVTKAPTTKDNGRLDVGGWTFGDLNATGTKTTIAWTGKNNGDNCSLRQTVYQNTQDSKYYMYDGWATVKIHKNECVAIGGDESAAKGYWLTFTVLEPGQETETVIHEGYLNNAMYTDTYDGVGLGNAMGSGTLTVRNVTPSARIDVEAGLDVGDYSLKETEYSKLHNSTVWGGNDELYIKGVDRESTGYRTYTNALTTYFNSGSSCGVEFRMKELSDLSAKLGTTIYYYLQVAVGSAQLDFYLDTTQTKLGIRMGYFQSSMKYEGNVANVFPYEVGAEYAVRVERVGVNPIVNSKVTYSETDYIVRVYMAKVGADGMVADDWDATPVYEQFTTRNKCNPSISNNNICIQPSNNTIAHTMRISSNKYVGVKTNVNGVEKLHKVVRGEDFTFANLITGENTICAGWSKGADTYSADDYVAANTVFENMTESKLDCTYRALTMTLDAAEQASLRLRRRGENPLEVSLNWAVTANDANSLGEYFGGIAFGYKLTASNGASTEEEVLKYTDGYTTPYAYSITQSNITSEYYGMKFVCQAYVELNGVKYYTELPDVESVGRSVEDVVTAALNDIVDTATEKDGYVNAVDVNGETKYTYLQAWQYNFLKNYIA